MNSERWCNENGVIDTKHSAITIQCLLDFIYTGHISEDLQIGQSFFRVKNRFVFLKSVTTEY